MGRLGPQRVLVARDMVPTGTTVGGGGQALEVDGVMVQGQGLVGLQMVLAGALALVLVLVLGLSLARDLVMGLVVVGLGLEVAGRVGLGIAHHRTLGTKRTMAS
jgi:hypothetical protein